jgi:GAF domain-containing protein
VNISGLWEGNPNVLDQPPDGAPHDLDQRLRELEIEVVREIAESFLTASSALEVYRLALARVTPRVGASFAAVFLRDEEDPRLLRLACAQNWPQPSARFLGALGIRVGRGPTGQAVTRGRPVEVVDMFEDPALKEWWNPARELGFVSMISLPLSVEDRTFGALSFYFAERQEFDDDDRRLLLVVAHQLATTAERAHLMAALRSSNLRLERENEALLRKLEQTESALSRVRERVRSEGVEAEGVRSGRSPGRAEESR